MVDSDLHLRLSKEKVIMLRKFLLYAYDVINSDQDPDYDYLIKWIEVLTKSLEEF